MRIWPTSIVAVALALSGCFHLSQPAPRIDQYRLEYTAQPPSGPALPYILRIPPMEVAATYDREPIVYRDGDYKVGAYFYSRWASNPGNMIASSLAHDIADSDLYKDVQTSVSMVAPDFQIKGTVEEIEEHIEAGDCKAHLALRVTLAASRGPRDQRIRSTKLYSAEETARCNDAVSLAAAMSRAMARISTELQEDVYQQLAQYRKTSDVSRRSE